MLLVPSRISFFLIIEETEQKFQETEKFHVRKVKCFVRATERKMSVWQMEKSDNKTVDLCFLM